MTQATTAKTDPEYLKVKAAAAALNVSPRQVYDLIHEGELEASNFGSGGSRLGLRVHADSLADFKQRRKLAPASHA